MLVIHIIHHINVFTSTSISIYIYIYVYLSLFWQKCLAKLFAKWGKKAKELLEEGEILEELACLVDNSRDDVFVIFWGSWNMRKENAKGRLFGKSEVRQDIL